MRKYLDNIKKRLGLRSYQKLADFLGVTKDAIMKWNRGDGKRSSHIAYILLSLCFDEMSKNGTRRVIEKYHSLLYKNANITNQEK